MSRNHEVDGILRDARHAGMTVERRKNGHYRISTDDGRYMVLAGSPGSCGAVSGARRDLEKLQRGESVVRRPGA